jgi:bacteriorhodopsin
LVLHMIWGALRAITRHQQSELAAFYDKLTTYFTVLWVSYPIVWIIGPSGMGWINQNIETFLFCLLPFFSKVGFSFIDLHGLRNLYSGHHSRTETDPVATNTFELFGFLPSTRRINQRTSDRRKIPRNFF